MMNLSSLSKTSWLGGFTCAIIFLLIIAPQFSNILLPAAFCLLILQAYYISSIRILVKKITDVTSQCAQGNMESRIILPKERGNLGAMINRINDSIDMADAYVRESLATLEHAAEEKY